MDRRLSEASLQGNVELLRQILDEDPLILDKIIVLCISQTPLHTASMLGHLNFVKELLNRKPELAAELDSNGSSPLHLAAAKGHVDIVKELLSADSEVGFVRNLDGRTALHVAVIKGRTAAATELVRVAPELSRVLTDRGETCLHLCVKYNTVEMLQNLAEVTKELDGDLLNWKDCDGNTILHIAVAKKQIEKVAETKEILSKQAVQTKQIFSKQADKIAKQAEEHERFINKDWFFFTIRWWDPVFFGAMHPEGTARRASWPYVENKSYLWTWLFFVPLVAYVLYFLIVNVLRRQRLLQDPEVMTSYRELSKKAQKANNVWWRLSGLLGDQNRLFMYILLQAIFTVATMALTVPIFLSYKLHVTFQILKISATTWNGGNFLLEVMPRQFMKKIEMQPTRNCQDRSTPENQVEDQD